MESACQQESTSLLCPVECLECFFYGFRVCSDFSQKATAGEVYYGLKPRKFMDVTGEMVQPDRAFKVTAEVLRRKPESALVWYEDFL